MVQAAFHLGYLTSLFIVGGRRPVGIIHLHDLLRAKIV